MFCKNCGKQLSDGAKFCSGCGTSLNESQAVKPPQPTTTTTASATGGIYTPPGMTPIAPNNSFSFQQGELLFASHYGARFNPVSSAGYLHVTNMRVVWTKSLGASMLSHGILVGAALANEFEIPLDTVTGVDAGRVRGSKGGITIHTSDNKKHLFAVTSKMGTCNTEAKEVKNTILNVLNYVVSTKGGMN